MIYRGTGFSPSYDLDLVPPPAPPPSREQVVSLSQSSCVSSVGAYLREMGGKESGPLKIIQYSLGCSADTRYAGVQTRTI
jgi:hypothetical protein